MLVRPRALLETKWFGCEVYEVDGSVHGSWIILGDFEFNARVGFRELYSGDDEQCSGVRGLLGYGFESDAGKELLSFLTLHPATVCNTWIEKRDIYKQTW